MTKLRSFMGYVGQEPVLFAMSIRENLKLAKPDATQAEIDKVLKDSNCTEFVNSLEKGQDTFVGVGGGLLSGGQKQRVAIARAMLLNPPILLLDESTSALDRKNEKEIQETLDQFAKNRTTITIAHRLLTIRNSDIIFVLKDGKVLEAGDHPCLMEWEGDEKKLYWKLVKQQEIHHMQESKLVDESGIHHDDQLVDHEAILDKPHPDTHHSINDVFKEHHEGQLEPLGKKLDRYEGSHANDKQRKEMRVRQESFTKYEHASDDGSVGLRQASALSNDPHNVQANSKIFSMNHLNLVSTGGASFLDNEQGMSAKASFLGVKVTNKSGTTSIPVPFRKLWADMGSAQYICALGFLASAGMGSVQPLVGYNLGDIIGTLVNLQLGVAGAENELNNIFFNFLGIAFGALICSLIQKGSFAYSGQTLTANIRNKFFAKLVNYDVAYFDNPDNNSGNICSNLEEDCNNLNHLVTDVIGLMFQISATLVISISLAFDASWRMSCCVLAVIPLLVLSGVIQGKARNAMEGSGEGTGAEIVQENVSNLKTVRGMNTLSDTLDRFDATVAKRDPSFCLILTEGLFYGFGQSIVLFVLAFLYYVGGIFMRDSGLSYSDMNKALMSLLFAGMGMGQASQFVGDVGLATIGAIRIYTFLEKKSTVSNIAAPQKITDFKGKIEFRNVSFRYPTRNEYIFKNMNWIIEPGQDAAFVGQSGSGKSTTIQLLLRFYNISSGQIF